MPSKRKKKIPLPKRPVGRPNKFFEANKELIFKLAARGFDDAEIAEVLGVQRQTVCNWKKKYPDFFDTLKIQKEMADSKVERALFERACGYSHPETRAQWVSDEKGGRWEYAELIKHYPPSEVACIFWLKNRKPEQWREKVDPSGASAESLAETLSKMAERLPG